MFRRSIPEREVSNGVRDRLRAARTAREVIRRSPQQRRCDAGRSAARAWHDRRNSSPRKPCRRPRRQADAAAGPAHAQHLAADSRDPARTSRRTSRGSTSKLAVRIGQRLGIRDLERDVESLRLGAAPSAFEERGDVVGGGHAARSGAPPRASRCRCPPRRRARARRRGRPRLRTAARRRSAVSCRSTAKSPDAHIACCLALIDDAPATCAAASRVVSGHRLPLSSGLSPARPGASAPDDGSCGGRRDLPARTGTSAARRHRATPARPASCSSVSARIAAAAAALLRRSRSIATSFVTAACSAACFGVHRVDVVHGHAGDRLAAGDGLRQLHLDRVHAGDVVNDDAHACGRRAACGVCHSASIVVCAKRARARAPSSRRSARASASVAAAG